MGRRAARHASPHRSRSRAPMRGGEPVVVGSRLPERTLPTEMEMALLIEVRDRAEVLSAWLERLSQALQGHQKAALSLKSELKEVAASDLTSV